VRFFVLLQVEKQKSLSSGMTEYTFKILGAQYAANPDYKFGDPETPEMWARTIGMLSNLRDMKPRVVLKKEPTNPNDHLAVMARADDSYDASTYSLDANGQPLNN
jgi:hypothetical protein